MCGCIIVCVGVFCMAANRPFHGQSYAIPEGTSFRISKGQNVGLRKVFVKFDMKESSKFDKNLRVS